MVVTTCPSNIVNPIQFLTSPAVNHFVQGLNLTATPQTTHLTCPAGKGKNGLTAFVQFWTEINVSNLEVKCTVNTLNPHKLPYICVITIHIIQCRM